jgi:SapC/SecA DEAD-like domain
MSSAAIRLHDGAVAIGRPYAERAEEEHGLHDQVAQFLLTTVVAPIHNRLRDPVEALATIVAHVERHEPSMRSMLDEELSVQARGMRIPLRRDGFTLEHVGRCFALAREAAARSIGQRHYRVQLMAGWGLLQGKLVEMETGEGKTIAATLAASAAALAGYPVHVITVNDYLAQRDADEMGPLYRLLGLSVGVVVQGMPKSARRQAYAESITYPIVFAGTKESFTPAVILGVRESQNLYLSQDAKWDAKYIPAFVRRYPFVFTKSDDEKRLVLCIDEAYAGFNQNGRGQRLFGEDGKPTEYVQNMLQFLQEYQAQFERTQAFCTRIRELDLLEPMQAQVEMRSGEKSSLTGFMAVNRTRLKALGGEKLAELANTDELELIYLHLQSMRNFQSLPDRLAGARSNTIDRDAATPATGETSEATIA